MRILGLFIGAAQTDKSFLDLDPLRFPERELGLVGEVLRDRICTNVDAPAVDLALLEKQQVAGLGPDIQEHGAPVEIAVAEPERIAEGGRRDVDQSDLEPGCTGHLEQAVDNLVLDRDQQHFQFAGRGRTQDLVVPNDFLQRERDVLLRFVGHDLGDLRRVDRRQLDELGKHMEAGGAEADFLRIELRKQFLKRFLNDILAGRFLGPFQAQGLGRKPDQTQRSGVVLFELGDLERSRSEIGC